MFSPDVVWTDHRSVVAFPPLRGIEAVGAGYTSAFGAYDDVAMEPTAVRGERLALYAARMTTDAGWESVARLLVGLDGGGRIDVLMTFDEDDLLGAVEEMDRRDRELRGDEYPLAEAVFTRNTLAVSRGDLETMTYAPGYRAVDHSPAGMGDADSAGHVEQIEIMVSQVPGVVMFSARLYSSGRAVLAYMPIRGTTEDGSEYVWELAVVEVVDDAGRIVEDHNFQIEQWDEARALFDERRSRPPGRPRRRSRVMENAATRSNARFRDVLATEGISALRTVMRDDYQYVDHRWGGVAPAATGPDAFLDHVRSARSAGFDETGFETLAIRGDRAEPGAVRDAHRGGRRRRRARGQRGRRRRPGHAHRGLRDRRPGARRRAARRVVPGGRGRRARMDDAVRVASSGVATTRVIGPGCGRGSPTTTGWSTTGPPARARRSRRPTSSSTTCRAWSSRPDMFAFETSYLEFGRRWCLYREMVSGTSTAGGEVQLEFVSVAELVDGVFTASEVYHPEQLTEALVRFQELEAEELALSPDAPATSGVGPTVRLTHAAVRKMEELAAVFAAFDWPAADLYPDDPVSEDRRTGVNSGSTSGPRRWSSSPLARRRRLHHGRPRARRDPAASGSRCCAAPGGVPTGSSCRCSSSSSSTTRVARGERHVRSRRSRVGARRAGRRYLAGDGAEHERFLRPLNEFWRS